jgi:hypothetical protein
MSNKNNKNSKQIVRDVKECFRSFHLPICKFGSNKELLIRNEAIFASEIHNDHTVADVIVFHRKKTGFVMFDVLFNSNEVSPEKMAEIRCLLDLLNRDRSIFHYSISQYCNCVSLRAHLFLSGERLPIGKCKRLIHCILEDAYNCFPLISAVINGGNYKDRYDRFMDHHKETKHMKSTISEKNVEKIMIDMEAVLASKMSPITDNNRSANSFTFIIHGIGKIDFSLGMYIYVDDTDKSIFMALEPPFSVPDEKIGVMMELIDRVNKIIGCGHIFVNHHNKKIILVWGIMIDNATLDKAEFETAINALLMYGVKIYPMIKEQITSNECPEVLFARCWGNNQGSGK